MSSSSHIAVSLLVLFIFLSSVQGIRLDKSFESTGHSVQEGATALMKNSNGVIGDAILCKQGHCSSSTGKGRKIYTATTSATTSKREDIKGENQANPISTPESAVNGGKQERLHDQNVDIMDYSPARRKTPIHN